MQYIDKNKNNRVATRVAVARRVILSFHYPIGVHMNTMWLQKEMPECVKRPRKGLVCFWNTKP